MVAGTRLTNTEPLNRLKKSELIWCPPVFPCSATVVLLSTIYNYTLSFVTEEQAVFPTPASGPLVTPSKPGTPV